MSTNDTKQPPASGQQLVFPPPPPGPPPAQSQAERPKPPNLAPVPNYSIPPYDPANPQFAPPPGAATATDDDIYDATPTDEYPPQEAFDRQSAPEEGKKKGWSHKLAGWGSKAAGPINALAHKMGSEAFLPSSLDKECEKAARILRGFCKDGFYGDATSTSSTAATSVQGSTSHSPPVAAGTDTEKAKVGDKARKSRVLLTIPPKVIARAQGLAVFTTVRAGFQVTGSSGSGILIARLADGSWSPPSGIQVHSIGAGFVAGLDIYDCVVVINTREALELFKKTRMSLGSDLAVTAGPFGAGGSLDWGVPEGKKAEKVSDRSQEAGTSAPAAGSAAALETSRLAPQTGDAATPPGSKRRPSPLRDAIKKPVYSYVKSRGLFAGVQIDGTIITERAEANAAFYGKTVSVAEIVVGQVPTQGPAGMWPAGARSLLEMLQAFEGNGTQGLAAAPMAPSAPTGPAPASASVSASVPSATGPSTTRVPGDAAATAPSLPSSGSKAAEVAAEAGSQKEDTISQPPSYEEEHHNPQDLPPAYVEREAPGERRDDDQRMTGP